MEEAAPSSMTLRASREDAIECNSRPIRGRLAFAKDASRLWPMDSTTRSEADVFNDLKLLCVSPGYIHVLAYLCYRDNLVGYSETLKGEDFRESFGTDRLIRTELSTLLGLLVKEEIDYSLPKPDLFQQHVDRTQELLNELHRCLASPMTQGIQGLTPDTIVPDFLSLGAVLREPIFYSGDSAYRSQYRDLSAQKYREDDQWLTANRGFTIGQAVAVAEAISLLQPIRLAHFRKTIASTHPDNWTVLPWFTFRSDELAKTSGEDITTVRKVLESFSVPKGERNNAFLALDDFNIANALPILQTEPDSFILLQSYSLYEAIYESPFFWMLGDRSYKDLALEHRGHFTEQFSKECLTRVFGRKHVYPNVTIHQDAQTTAGEIDTLVLFGNRAIVLQAKSKRLTLEARKGNDGVIRDDFTKSIEDSYAQALNCAELLLQGELHFSDSGGSPLAIPELKVVYLFCVVSDHYPALSFQTRQFLEATTSYEIPAPFVMDLFTLDVMAEMLESPLHFMSYVDRRTGYSDKIAAGHELTILSYHLKTNLWLSGEYDHIMLADDLSTDLDVAMAVRRDKVPGQRTPSGILTHNKNTAFGRLISEIEFDPRLETIDLGFTMLKMSGDAASQLSKGIDLITQLTREDKQPHDFSLGAGDTGLTVHCNSLSRKEAALRLQAHVELRKYKMKAPVWFGISVSPQDGSLQFGYNAEFAWVEDPALEAAARSLSDAPGVRLANGKPSGKKVGRNDPCPCGGGKKFKRCHGR
jgi:hypothetical protein